MVLVPAARLVYQGDELVGTTQLFQHDPPVVAAGQGVAQRAAQSFQDRRLQQELAALGRVLGQDFAGDVGMEIVIVAAEGGDVLVDVACCRNASNNKFSPAGQPSARTTNATFSRSVRVNGDRRSR